MGVTPHRAPQRPGRAASDKAITLLFICLAPVVCLVASFWGAFSIMGTAACGTECGAAVDISIYLMIFSPWVLWLIASVWAIVRLAKKKTASSVMVCGLAVETVVYVGANMVLFTVLG